MRSFFAQKKRMIVYNFISDSLDLNMTGLDIITDMIGLDMINT